jgi:hypothetical protein
VLVTGWAVEKPKTAYVNSQVRKGGSNLKHQPLLI